MAAKKVEEALAKWRRSTRGIRNPLVAFNLEKVEQATKALLEVMAAEGCKETELGLTVTEAEEFQLLKKSIEERTPAEAREDVSRLAAIVHDRFSNAGQAEEEEEEEEWEEQKQ